MTETANLRAMFRDSCPVAGEWGRPKCGCPKTPMLGVWHRERRATLRSEPGGGLRCGSAGSLPVPRKRLVMMHAKETGTSSYGTHPRLEPPKTSVRCCACARVSREADLRGKKISLGGKEVVKTSVSGPWRQTPNWRAELGELLIG